MFDEEEIEREGTTLGWLKLMYIDGGEEVLTVVQWEDWFFILSHDHQYFDFYCSSEEAFGAVAAYISGAVLCGGAIASYEIPDGWFLGVGIDIRPMSRRTPAAATPQSTPVAEWLRRRGWSIYEAALRTAFSESSLGRWARGSKKTGGKRIPVQVPRYVERMMELVDALTELGAEPERWEPCRLDAKAFAHWVDRRPRSQSQAAEMLGIAKSQVSAWVRGRAAVPVYITRVIGLIEMQHRLREAAD